MIKYRGILILHAKINPDWFYVGYVNKHGRTVGNEFDTAKDGIEWCKDMIDKECEDEPR